MTYSYNGTHVNPQRYHSYMSHSHESFTMSYVPFTAVTCPIHMSHSPCPMSHSQQSHVPFTSVTWLIHTSTVFFGQCMQHARVCAKRCIHMCDMTYLYESHFWYICVTWRMHTCKVSFITCVTWSIHTCDVTRSHGSHVWFTRVTWPTHTCKVSFIHATWLIRMCDMSHAHLWHDSSIHAASTRVSHAIYSHVRCDSFICAMWLIHMRFIHPLTEEIRLKRFASRDLSGFPIRLLSDGDSVYTLENLYENVGTPVKTCLIFMGASVKTCCKFWQS